MAFLIQLLPLILQILAALFGGLAGASHIQLEGNVSASGPYATYVGTYAALSAGSLALGSGVRFLNGKWLEMLKLLSAILKFIGSDPESARRFKEIFGFTVPASAGEFMKMTRG